jgi:AraC-like DNA-binding protein
VRYHEYAPSAGLSAIVQKYWILEGSSAEAAAQGDGASSEWEWILPDGRAELIFHYGEPFARRWPDARIEVQPRAMFVGQITAPICLLPRGMAGVAAIRLRPEATGLLGPAAAAITNRFEPLDGVARTGEALDRLAGAGSNRERIEVLEQFLTAVVRTAPRPEVAFAIRCLTRRGGALSIDALSTAAGVPRRQLERRFQSDVGLSPKTFARLLRLNRAAGLILKRQSLVDVAATCGYFDQAHMSNDFRRLIQQSPHEWQRMAGTLGPLFVGAA